MATMRLIFVVMMMTLYLSEIRGDPDEKNELSNKKIKETLEILTNEITDLKDEVKELRSKEGLLESHSIKNLSVIWAARQLLPDGQFCFTVRYKSVGPLKTVHRWMTVKDQAYSYVDEYLSNEILMLPLYEEQASVIVPAQNNSFVLFMFGTTHEWLNLYLVNSWEGDVNQTDIELPFMEVSPDPEFVYKPGHNLTLKLAAPTEKERIDPRSGLPHDNKRMEYRLVLPWGKKLITKHSHSEETEPIFTEGKQQKFLDKIRFQAVLNTAKYPLSGVVDFTTGRSDVGAFVEAIEYSRVFVLRPTTQKGAFPKGSLFDAGMDWNEKNEEGEYQIYCQFDEPCYVFCDMVGDDLTGLKMYERINGGYKVVPFNPIGGEDGPTDRIVGYYEVSLEDQTGPLPRRFKCVGSNTKGRTVSRPMAVYIKTEVKIVDNETHWENYGNGSAQITCTATGQPRPKMIISCNYDSGTEPQVIYQTDDVISLTQKCHNLRAKPFITCDVWNNFGSDHKILSGTDYSMAK